MYMFTLYIRTYVLCSVLYSMYHACAPNRGVAIDMELEVDVVNYCTSAGMGRPAGSRVLLDCSCTYVLR